MTIRKLKELIADYPNDARIYLDDGVSFFESNSEVVALAKGVREYDKKIVLQTKQDIDVSNELTSALTYASENDIDEYDFFLELGELGYDVEDFKYNPEMYEWVKEFSKTHAW